MFEYYNAHPQGKNVNDCVKRAITVASGMAYEDVARELNRYKKITGAAKFNDRKNCDAYVVNILHGTKLSFPPQAGRPRMNGERFCSIYPKGNYILNMAGHWSVCIDGVIKDTWDPSLKCVYSAWKIEPHKYWFTIQRGIKPHTFHIIVEKGSESYITQDFTKSEVKGYVTCLMDLGFKERGK